MCVEGPGIGPLDAGRQRTQVGDDPGPDPERAVDVEPGPGGADDVGDGIERIERPGVHLSGLRHHDRRPVDAFERGGQCLGDDPAPVVGLDQAEGSGPEPEKTQCPVDGRVASVPGDDGDGGCPEQPLCGDVPPDVGEHPVAGRGQGGDVCHLTARHESGPRPRRQLEQLEQPALGHVLDHGHGRRGDVGEGVLVPRGGQPVRPDGDRLGTAGHEAEVAASLRAHQAGRDIPGQLGEDVGRIGGTRGQRAVDGRPQVLRGDGREHGCLVDLVEVRDGEIGRGAERFGVHPRHCKGPPGPGPGLVGTTRGGHRRHPRGARAGDPGRPSVSG